jgi:predicted alpha/beta hydrolase
MELEFQYYFTEHLLISTIIIVRLAGSLSKNGFQVIGIDFRGYGESDKSNDSNFTARQNK